MKFINSDDEHPKVTAEDIKSAFENMYSIFASAHPEMSDALSNFLQLKGKVAFIEANEIIVDYGQVCNCILFSLKGVVRSNFIIEGKEIPVWFSTPKKVIIAVDSWYNQTPSEEQLTAIQDTLCIAYSWEDFEEIYKTHPEFNIHGRKLTEFYLQESLRRTLWIHYSAYKKYKLIIKQYWDIVKEISFTELAKFLGVARETLSRLRNKKWLLI